MMLERQSRLMRQDMEEVEQQGRLAEALERQAIPSKALEERQALVLARRAERARLELNLPAAGNTADTAEHMAGNGEDIPLSARAFALRPTSGVGGGASSDLRYRGPGMSAGYINATSSPALRQAAARSALSLSRGDLRCNADLRAAEDHAHVTDKPSYAEGADAQRALLGGLDAHPARVRQLRESVPAVPLLRCCPLGHTLVEGIWAGANELEGDDSMKVAAFLRCGACDSAVARGGALYSCTPCDFDLCEACCRGVARDAAARPPSELSEAEAVRLRLEAVTATLE